MSWRSIELKAFHRSSWMAMKLGFAASSARSVCGMASTPPGVLKQKSDSDTFALIASLSGSVLSSEAVVISRKMFAMAMGRTST